MYAAARVSRLTSGWSASGTSADAELSSSLATLRGRSRQLVRDAAYAKRAKRIVVNNVIGSGVGMQAQVMSTRGELREDANAAIETAWDKWSRASSCHTGGQLCFPDLERAAMGQVFEAGEAFLRMHMWPFGDSRVPFALELIEAERLADTGAGTAGQSGAIRMGIEVDDFQRPVAYYIRRRHPGDLAGSSPAEDRIERVPASEIIHLRIVDRWPQTRGEPWLHAVARRLNDMDGYAEAEIVAARGAASYMATIETDADTTSLGEQNEDGSVDLELTPGLVTKLDPGEKLNFVSPNRPNAAMDPFMRLMLREVAAGADVSYESLSRDYSQSNYSSSRLALIDDRDLWRTLQSWWIRNFREPVHRIWLQQAVLSRAIQAIRIDEYAADRDKFEAVRFKPRGWSWIDPTKEVNAFKEAEKAGYITKSQIIAQTANGLDIEDMLLERQRELEMAEDKGLVFDTDPDVFASGTEAEAEEDQAEDETEPDAEDESEIDAGTAAEGEARILKMKR
jgi:lambda family phage portal protein